MIILHETNVTTVKVGTLIFTRVPSQGSGSTGVSIQGRHWIICMYIISVIAMVSVIRSVMVTNHGHYSDADNVYLSCAHILQLTVNCQHLTWNGQYGENACDISQNWRNARKLSCLVWDSISLSRRLCNMHSSHPNTITSWWCTSFHWMFDLCQLVREYHFMALWKYNNLMNGKFPVFPMKVEAQQVYCI
jgi:hypothetical protein